MNGWIKLHRKILASDMYQSLNSKQRDVLITLLLMANHKEKQWEYKGEIYTAEPGQMVTSLESIKKNCAKDVTIQNIRTTLKKLETWGFLTNQSTKTGRLITIVNWRLYQDEETETNKDDNKELTKNQQRANKELTTNKNDKRMIKNDKEIYNAQSYSEDFEKFWSVYPKKIGKKRAYSLWLRRLKEVDPDELIQCAENYARHCKRNATPTKYIKHPSTFLSDKQDYLDWLEVEEETPNNVHPFPQRKMSYWEEQKRKEEEYERQRIAARDREIAVQDFIRAGLNPMKHGKMLLDWLERGAKRSELPLMAKKAQEKEAGYA